MYPIILGISGQTLTDEERDLFRAFPPFGFILFNRNVDNVEQLKHLTTDLRELTGRPDMPILMDQEGGRVQKLGPPNWINLPFMRPIGDLFEKNSLAGMQAIKLHAEIVAGQLNEIGVDVVCAPVVDVPVPGSHNVIGGRAFSENVDIVVPLASELAKNLFHNGVTPVIKHIPGHGRADVDSHFACPVVKTDLETLNKTDFKAFRQVAQNIGAEKTWAMTAHVVFAALDDKPVTLSRKSIDYIRSELGISGPVIADTIEMNALGGTFIERAAAALEAGCDAVLYCSGKFAETKNILASLSKMEAVSIERFTKTVAQRPKAVSLDWKRKYEDLKNICGVSEFPTYHARQDITEELAALAS